MRESFRSIILTGILLVLSGCTFWTGTEQPLATETTFTIAERETIGQTFVAHYAGLEGLELYIIPQGKLRGDLLLHLLPDQDAEIDLALARLPAESITSPDSYRFYFEPQADSNQRYYYAYLELEGEGEFQIDCAGSDAYLDGAMYVNHEPNEQQLAFRLLYAPPMALWGLAGEMLSWTGIFLAGIFVYLIPGLATLICLFPDFETLSLPTRFALACGLSIALYPILFLWTDLIGIHLGSLYGWLPVCLGTLFLLWHYRSWRPSPSIGKRLIHWMRSKSSPSDLALISVVGLSLLVRFILVRSIELPLWGDSVHHTMISQLMVMNDGLFDSWHPLAELQSLTYHFGFHANVAVLHWVTGASVPQAVLWAGQLFNFLAVFCLLPLAQKAGKSRWTAVIVLCVAGLLSPLPNVYTHWGRYPQLAGQVILPCAIFIIWEITERETPGWRLMGLACIALAGLGLTHYRVLIFAILFLLAFLLTRIGKKDLKRTFLASSWIGIGAGLIFLPWFIHTFAGRITTNFLRSLTTPANATTEWTSQYNSIGELSYYLPWGMWLAFIIAIGLGVWKRKKGLLLVLLWWGLILLATNPQWLRLPGEGVISNFALFIAAYIPVSLTIGVAASWIMDQLSPAWRKLSVGLLIILAFLGMFVRLADLDLGYHTLATRSDIRAAQWIQENTAPDTKFLTQAFFAYNDTIIVGSDGGWWLPLLAQRSTTLPPASYGTEKGPRADYRTWINALLYEIQSKGITHADVLDQLARRQVTHVYIGQLHSRENPTGVDILPLQTLLANEHFHLIYHRDHVWIFEFIPDDPVS